MLKNLAADFEENSVKTIEDFQSSFSKTHDFSKWLISNRRRADFQLLLKGQALPHALDPKYKNTLWTNLFYQIITKKSASVRDMAMSLLQADNFLIHVQSSGTPEDAIELQSLANARVVIPEYFLNGKKTIEPNIGAIKHLAINDKSLRKKLDALVVDKQIAELQFAVQELNNLKKEYDKQNNQSYDEAKKEHAKKVDDLNRNAKKTQRTYIDKETGIERTLTDQEYFETPNFEYEPISQPDFIANSGLISHGTLGLVQQMPIVNPSISDAIANLEEEIGNQSGHLVNIAPPTSETIIDNGGVLLPVLTTPPTTHLGNLVLLSAQSAVGNSALTLLFNNLPLGTDDVSAEYSVQSNRPAVSGDTFTDSWANNNLTVDLFPQGFIYGNLTSFTLTGHLILSDFTKIEFEIQATVSIVRNLTGLSHKKVEGAGMYEKTNLSLDEGEDENTPSETDQAALPNYGITQLGIADYRKVEQEICCYVPGEVSHIENIMAREFKEKTVRRSRKSEETYSSTNEVERENLTDTSTTERFEMNQEASSIISKDTQLAAQAGIHWGDKNFGGNANASFAHSTASETSNHQALTHAKEMTERALDRVVQKVKEERISKITEEYSEENTHGFDNRKGEEHVSGVYRWVDKIYNNKVVNYGKRLMYEFMIPEPSAFHNTIGLNQQNTLATTIVKPIDPRKQTGSLQLINAGNETISTYLYWAGIYNAEIEAFPETEISVGESFNIIGSPQGAKLAKTESNAGNGKIKIPEDYAAYMAKGNFTASGDYHDGAGNILSLSVGNVKERYNGAFFQYSMPLSGSFEGGIINEVPVSFTLGNHVAGDISVVVKCRLTNSAKQAWRIQAFNAIIKAYELKQREFEEKLSSAKSAVDEKSKTNPGFYRQIENMVLRKNCISYLMGHDRIGQNMLSGSTLENMHVQKTAALNHYTAEAKFLEQAFEWELMSYHFYPFYWANKEKWAKLYNPNESNDPIFRSFLQSGMAKVIVTVRPGFEEAVNWYLATREVWNGGQVPTINDPLFLSIVEELRITEGEIEETWETRVPTALTVIQAGSLGLNVLEALPCDDSCDDNLLFSSDGNPITDKDGEVLKSFKKQDALLGGRS